MIRCRRSYVRAAASSVSRLRKPPHPWARGAGLPAYGRAVCNGPKHATANPSPHSWTAGRRAESFDWAWVGLKISYAWEVFAIAEAGRPGVASRSLCQCSLFVLDAAIAVWHCGWASITASSQPPMADKAPHQDHAIQTNERSGARCDRALVRRNPSHEESVNDLRSG